MNKLDNLIAELCPDGVEWKTLGEVVKIKNGKDWKHLGTGIIPVYGSGGVMGYVDKPSYTKVSVLIPRKGTITNIFYTEEPFWNVDTIFYTEINESQIIPKYLYHFMSSYDLTSLSTESTRPSLTQTILNKIQLPIPPLAVQAEIVRILDNFTELTAELTARKKQYSYYRDELLAYDVVRGRDSSVGADLCVCPQFATNENDHEGAHIGAPLHDTPTTNDRRAEWKTLGEVATTVTAPAKVKKEVYRETGKIPIIDQGIEFIAGYTDENLEPVKADRYIVFGDHSEHIKYIDFAFIQGADGLKILKTISDNSKYVYYAFLNFYQKELNYKRHWSSAKETPIPIPPLAEQARIVAILDKFDALTNSITEGLPREIELRKQQYEHYREKLLTFPRKTAVS